MVTMSAMMKGMSAPSAYLTMNMEIANIKTK
jgi:hypothetical protein